MNQISISCYEEEWEDGNDILTWEALPYLLNDEDVEVIENKIINASIKAIDEYIKGNKDVLDICTLNYNKGCSVTIDEEFITDEDLKKLWNGYIGDISRPRDKKDFISELKELKKEVADGQLTISVDKLETYQLKNK